MKFLWYNLHHVGDHAFISKSWKSYKVTSVSELEKSRNIVVQQPRWGLNFLVHNQQICLESKIKCINSIDLLLFSFFSPFSPYFSLFFFSFRKPTYLSWPPKNGRHFVSHIHHTLKLKNLKVIKTVSRFKKVYKNVQKYWQSWVFFTSETYTIFFPIPDLQYMPIPVISDQQPFFFLRILFIILSKRESSKPSMLYPCSDKKSTIKKCLKT